MRILILLLFIGTSVAAQQSNNSKIMALLNKQFNGDNLYFQPLNMTLQKFENNIVSQQKNVDLSIGNEDKFRFSKNRRTFENAITVVSKNILLFNKYLADTLIFYFNDNKLNKCVWHFKIKKNENEAITKLLTQQLGNSGYDGSQNWGGPYWADNSMQLNLVLDSVAMTIDRQKSQNKFRSAMYGEENKAISYDNGSFTLEFEMFETEETVETPKTKHEILESAIKSDKEGKGIGSFSLSLAKLENIIKSNTTLKQLENQLGEWNSYGADNNLGYEWDDKTQDHTIPLFQIQYSTSIKNKYYTLRTEVSPTLTNHIKYLEVITILNGMQLTEFKKSLANSNYLINEPLTDIFKKQTWQNEAKKLMVTIKSNANGTYSIGIR